MKSKYIKSSMDSFKVSNEEIDFYNKNGYLHLKNVFTKDEMSVARQHMDEFAKKKGMFTIYLDMHFHKSLKEIHRGQKMCNIADALIGGARAIPIGSTAFFCKPGNNLEHGSVWHQDNYAGRSTPGSYLNIAVSVDDADKDNGSLIVAPGSHKLGDLPCNPKPNFDTDAEGNLYNCSPIGNNCILPKDYEIVQLEYNSGDVLAVHGLLVHKAEPNMHLSRWRRTMYNVYIKENEPFWPGWTAKRQLLDRYDSPNFKSDKK